MANKKQANNDIVIHFNGALEENFIEKNQHVFARALLGSC